MSRHNQASLISIAVAAILSPALASAQNEPSKDSPVQASVRESGLEEVVVTAQKRQESLQDVPIAVTALTAAVLQDAHITGLDGMASRVPNFQFGRQPSSAALAGFSIRGVLSNDSQSQVDNGVSVYLDGVYLGRNATNSFDIADIERVEVLRGPQGTLFGRNTTGGAINFITRAPTGEFGIKEDLTIGRYDEFRSRTRIDLPAWGPLSASITYLHREIDGWVENKSAGLTRDFQTYTEGHIGRVVAADTLGAEDVDSIYIPIRYDNGGAFTADYKFDYQDFAASQAGFQTLGTRPENDPFLNPLGPTVDFIYSLQPGLGGTNTVAKEALDAIYDPNRGTDTLRVMGHGLTLQWKLNDNLTIKNIASYRTADAKNVGNSFEGNLLIDPFGGTGNLFTLLTALSTREQHQMSNELQILGDGDALTWVAGAFYFDEGGRDYNPVPFFFTYPNPPENFAQRPGDMFANVDYENESTAIFAQATWHATDKLDLTAGARQTWDDRQELNYRPDLQTPDGPPTTKVKNDKLTWQGVAEYSFNPDLMVYGKVGTGYLSGGVYNTDAFDPEEITSYEVGLKGEFFDNRLRVNAAAFHSDYKDLQVFYFTTRVFYENAGKAKIDGLELEVTANPLDGLTLFGNLGLLDFEYEEYISAVGGGPPTDIADIADRAYTPDATMSLGAVYETQPMSSGAFWRFSVDGQWTDDMDFFVTIPIQGDDELANAAIAEAHWDLNARIGIADLPFWGSKATVSIWGKNLLDEQEPLYVADISGLISGSFQRPVTYGLDLTVQF